MGSAWSPGTSWSLWIWIIPTHCVFLHRLLPESWCFAHNGRYCLPFGGFWKPLFPNSIPVRFKASSGSLSLVEFGVYEPGRRLEKALDFSYCALFRFCHALEINDALLEGDRYWVGNP